MQERLFNDLIPCPWCGEQPYFIVDGKQVQAYAWKRTSLCSEPGRWTGEVTHYCKKAVGVHIEVQVIRDTKAEAIQAVTNLWNGRANA